MRLKPIHALILIVPAGMLIGLVMSDWVDPAPEVRPGEGYVPPRSGDRDRLAGRSAPAVPRDALIDAPPYRSGVDYSAFAAGEDVQGEDYPDALDEPLPDRFAAEDAAERAAIAAASAVSEAQAVETAARIASRDDEQPAERQRPSPQPPSEEPERSSGLPAIW